MNVRKRRMMRRARAAKMTAKGREIVASLTDAIQTERAGVAVETRFTVRTVDLPHQPKIYDALGVRATRHRIGVSQVIFSQLLGVSAMLVRAWEQGQRRPAMWARRLLDEVNRDPGHWRAMFRKAS